MNLDKIINDIENIGDISDRCIAYSEVILHLKTLREYMAFRQEPVAWKDDINSMIVKESVASIDEAIAKIKEMIKFNVEVNKLI